jgi:hypothetical protein
MKTILRIGALLWIANEVRGFCLALPVFWTMWQSGGTLMALWLGLCSLIGIALSVLLPMWALKRLRA